MSELAIELDDVHLSFPRVRYHPGGVKEAFLSFVLGRTGPKEAREFWALRGISVRVKKGEVIGLVGKNGSGKTTLLRVIGGIYEPDKGKATTNGQIAALELGSGFREELTGLENIRLSGAIMGMSPRQIDVLEKSIIDFADIGEFIAQPLRTYSSGMKSRLGFAVASVVEPDILLVDEVLAVGDADFREKSMARMEALVTSHDTTVVIVSHSLGELERLCSRCILIEKGLAVADGPPDEIIARYTGKPAKS